MSAVCPSSLIVSVIPKAVSGLTKHDAASIASVPSCKTRQSRAFTMRCVEYIPPARTATICPCKARACSSLPVSITVPAPSLPTGIAWSIRAARASIAPSGSNSVRPFSDFEAVAGCAPARRSPRSLGLIGDASTTMSTSSGPGVGTSNSSILR